MDAGRGHDQRHDQRGREAVGRDVAQHHPDPAARQPGEGVEVSAHRFGRPESGGHLRHALQHGGRGQQAELELVGQFQFALEPLPAEVPFDQPGVLDGGADLVGDRGEEPHVGGGKGVGPEPVGEVDDPDAAGLESRAPRR